MRAAPGFLSEREGRFLTLAAAAAPGKGAILEIGSFKGKSTVGLASIARHYSLPPVVAVDPFTAPSRTDPDLGGAESSLADFQKTIRTAGLEPYVEVHQMRSDDLARTWNRPLRFLWIDGDHTYSGALADIRNFGKHLEDGAVVAFHDALSPFEGPLRVFVEEVLHSDQFGAAGFVGSIAWAQFRPHTGSSQQIREPRLKLARKAARLIPFLNNVEQLTGLRRVLFKLLRSLVPHGEVEPAHWVEVVNRSSQRKRG